MPFRLRFIDAFFADTPLLITPLLPLTSPSPFRRRRRRRLSFFASSRCFFDAIDAMLMPPLMIRCRFLSALPLMMPLRFSPCFLLSFAFHYAAFAMIRHAPCCCLFLPPPLPLFRRLLILLFMLIFAMPLMLSFIDVAIIFALMLSFDDDFRFRFFFH